MSWRCGAFPFPQRQNRRVGARCIHHRGGGSRDHKETSIYSCIYMYFFDSVRMFIQKWFSVYLCDSGIACFSGWTKPWVDSCLQQQSCCQMVVLSWFLAGTHLIQVEALLFWDFFFFKIYLLFEMTGEGQRESLEQIPCWVPSPVWDSIPWPWDHDLSLTQESGA